MGINMQKKELSLNKCCINQDVSKWIEQDIIVPDTKPDAVKIVNVNVTPYVNNVENMDGKIRITGKLNYFIIYKVDDEMFNTRGLFMCYPYTEILDIESMTSDMNTCVKPIVKNVIYSLPNERKIAIKSEVIFKVIAKKPVCVNVVKNFDNDTPIECKMCSGSFNNIKQNKKSIIVSKEDIMLPKEAENFFEILNVEARIKNTEYKESYNKIMVKGDIAIKMLYLTENKEDEVKKINISIPFSAMVELENISDRSKFDINYIMQDFNIRLNDDITSTKTMTADYQIQVEVTMFEEENEEYVEDFYSQNRDLTYDDQKVDVVRRDIKSERRIDIKENMTGVVPQNNKIIDYKIDTTNVMGNINQGVVTLEGNAKVSLLLQNTETMELEDKTIDVLINETFELDDFLDNVKMTVDIIDHEIIVTQDGMDMEARIMLNVGSKIEDVAILNIIDKIEEIILDSSNLDSINIYIVKPGDTLWSIAKRYKTSVDKIVRTNNIENPDKINVGQKILIIR